MKDYIIATDSGCDFTPEDYLEYNIVPLYMEYDAQGSIERDDPDPAALKKFYNRMREGTVMKTSQVNTHSFIEFFKDLYEKEKKPILYISLGSGISGTYANAVTAANELMSENEDMKIRVVDSLGASYMIGMLCIRANKNRLEGMSIEDNAKDIEENRLKVNVYFTTNELTYLHRGGRVSKTSAVLGSMLGINPILSVNNKGELYVINKARGAKKTLARIEKYIEESVTDPENNIFYYSHSDCQERADEMVDQIKNKFGFKGTHSSYIGSIIGAHTGPGLVSFYYYGKTRE